MLQDEPWKGGRGRFLNLTQANACEARKHVKSVTAVSAACDIRHPCSSSR